MLATRMAKGDVAALEALYDRHSALVLGIALKITGDQTLAENVLQETFWHVWQGENTHQREDISFKVWLFRMARSLAMDVHQQSRAGRANSS